MKGTGCSEGAGCSEGCRCSGVVPVQWVGAGAVGWCRMGASSREASTGSAWISIVELRERGIPVAAEE